MPEKPTKFALNTPFNLFPDGSDETLIFGLGLGTYSEGQGLAVFLIFKGGGGRQLSVCLPQHVEQTDKNEEFFLKDWADNVRAAEVCRKEGLIMDTDSQSVQSGERQVKIVKVNRSALRDMTLAEAEQYKQ